MGHFESGNAWGVKTIKCTGTEKHRYICLPLRPTAICSSLIPSKTLQEWPRPSERDRPLSPERRLTVCHDTNGAAMGRKLFKQHGCIGAVCLRRQESMWRLLPGGPKICFRVKELVSNTWRRLCHNPNRTFFYVLSPSSSSLIFYDFECNILLTRRWQGSVWE